VRYVAGGIGIALLARLAYNLSDKYPELSRFFRENLDTIEDKLQEFRGISEEERISESRH
jgi:ABC-type Zn uptake system ZnuABC Zn-binding protein ZnuA